MYVVGPPRRPAPAGGTPQSVLLYDGCYEMCTQTALKTRSWTKYFQNAPETAKLL